jgi:hypothetical protein
MLSCGYEGVGRLWETAGIVELATEQMGSAAS